MSIGATATGSLPVPASHPEIHRLCVCVCAGWSQKTIGQSRSSSTRPLDANRLRSRFFLDNLHLIVIHDSMNSSGAMSLYRLWHLLTATLGNRGTPLPQEQLLHATARALNQ